MAMAMTNEERFLASCAIEGEAGVRQKLHGGRYGERRAAWAGAWLEEVESGKSDATKAEESRSSLLKPKKRNGVLFAVLALLGSGAIAFFVSR